MRRIPWISLLLVLFCFRSAPVTAQDEPSQIETDATAALNEEDEVDLADLTIPGEPHELLAGTVGDWELTIRIWTAPDTEPVESSGTASGRWILGERFVETAYAGTVMDREFEALKIEGYEKASSEYVTTWRDNLGTYTMIFRGRCDTTCLTRTMTADFLDPVSATKLKIKGVTTLTEDEGYTYESFVVTPDGKEFKNMELVAERPTS
jgi:hypothetical protein